MSKRRFRLLRGIHSEGTVTYIAGTENDVIETDKDLKSKLHDPLGNRYEALDLVQPISTSSDTGGLETMTVAELKAMAEDEEIDLGSATTKAQIIDIISAAGEPA